MRNKLVDVRNHMFQALEMLIDGEIDTEKAKAVANLGKVIIDSAKVEVQHMGVISKVCDRVIPISDFFEINNEQINQLTHGKED